MMAMSSTGQRIAQPKHRCQLANTQVHAAASSGLKKRAGIVQDSDTPAGPCGWATTAQAGVALAESGWQPAQTLPQSKLPDPIAE